MVSDSEGSNTSVTLFIVDEPEGEGRMSKTVPSAFTSYSGMDIGRDNGLVVDLDYEDRAPYVFTETVRQVVFVLKPATRNKAEQLHGHATIHGVGAAG